MIIEELKNIIKNPNDKNLGNKLNNLYNEFREGRDPNDILILLNSEDEMIGFGCDICCEISVQNTSDRNTLINKLYDILKHNKNTFNKERAFDALYGFYMDVKDIEGFNKICKEFKDADLSEISHFATNFLKDSSFKL